MTSTQSVSTHQNGRDRSAAHKSSQPFLATKADLVKIQATLTRRFIIVFSIAVGTQVLLIRAI